MGVNGLEIGMEHLTGDACGVRVLGAPPGLVVSIAVCRPMARAMGYGTGAAPRLGLLPFRGAEGSGFGRDDSRVVRIVEAAGAADGGGARTASVFEWGVRSRGFGRA